MSKTISVGEDLKTRPNDRYRFCATLDGDTDPERGGFGATEKAAVTMLARMSGDCYSHFTKDATFVRFGLR